MHGGGEVENVGDGGGDGGIIPARFAIFAFDRRWGFGYIPACED